LTGVVTAPRVLDLDDFGTEIGQYLSRPRARQDAAQVQHHQPVQRSWHGQEVPVLRLRFVGRQPDADEPKP
jgi:hypothetical protein